jgi:hypothetical protein
VTLCAGSGQSDYDPTDQREAGGTWVALCRTCSSWHDLTERDAALVEHKPATDLMAALRASVAHARHWDHQLHDCRNPLCARLTTALYCCPGCSSAHEGRYEIHGSGPLGHSPECDARYADRTGRGLRSTRVAP